MPSKPEGDPSKLKPQIQRELSEIIDNSPDFEHSNQIEDILARDIGRKLTFAGEKEYVIGVVFAVSEDYERHMVLLNNGTKFVIKPEMYNKQQLEKYHNVFESKPVPIVFEGERYLDPDEIKNVLNDPREYRFPSKIEMEEDDSNKDTFKELIQFGINLSERNKALVRKKLRESRQNEVESKNKKHRNLFSAEITVFDHTFGVDFRFGKRKAE